MPTMGRIRNQRYPGIYAIESRTGEMIFYMTYRRPGSRKVIEEKCGKQSQGMSFARASRLRAKKIEDGLPSNEEKRQAERAEKEAERNRWTVNRVFDEYMKSREADPAKSKKAVNTDRNRYDKYIRKPLGDKEPGELLPLDIERLKRNLLKKLSPQTTAHVLGLLTWALNYGSDQGLYPPLSFKIKKPEVNNRVTENLTPEQLGRLLEEIEKDRHPQAGPMMLCALYTGMRRGEMFKLEWRDLDFENRMITLRDPKGKKDVFVPMNDAAEELFINHPKVENKEGGFSEFVFAGRDGGKRQFIRNQVNAIKERSGLPKKFRALHGLRHVHASMLANSGKVDLLTLSKLLGHSSTRMTERYSHLIDQTKRRASNVISETISQARAEIEAVKPRKK